LAFNVLGNEIAPPTASMVNVFVKVTPIAAAGAKAVLLRKMLPPRLSALPLVKVRLIRESDVPTVLPKVTPPAVPAVRVRVRFPLALVRAPLTAMLAPAGAPLVVFIATSAPSEVGPFIVMVPPEVV
jgi:hypothetical protein